MTGRARRAAVAMMAVVMTFIGAGRARGQATGVESFDQPGASWSDTLFSDIHMPGNGAIFNRLAHTAGYGVPNTSPPLPIN